MPGHLSALAAQQVPGTRERLRKFTGICSRAWSQEVPAFFAQVSVQNFPVQHLAHERFSIHVCLNKWVTERLHEGYITHSKWSVVWGGFILIRERQKLCLPHKQRSHVMGSCDRGSSGSASPRVRLGNSPIVVLSWRMDSQGETKGPGNQARKKKTRKNLF